MNARSTSLPIVFVVFSACGAGCAPTPASPPVVVARDASQAPRRPAASTSPAAGTREVVAWGSVGEGAPVSFWMTLGPGGPRARGQREGIVAATEQGVWRWVSEPVHVVTKACEAGPGMGGPAGKGEAERASLVRLAGGQRIPVVAPDATTDVSELTSSVTVVGTVGPYWFVREATFIYACGAHGSTGMSAAVIDARGGARVEVLSAEEKAQVDRVERRDALEKVRADKEAGFGEIDAKDLQLAAFLPGWKDGALAMRVQFAAPACYACTDGEWSSYTRSTFVPLRAQPRSLTPYARMPAEIAAHAREAKITVRGWSEVPAHAGEVAAMAEFFGGRR